MKLSRSDPAPALPSRRSVAYGDVLPALGGRESPAVTQVMELVRQPGASGRIGVGGYALRRRFFRMPRM
jgi:hypothetical protein